MSRVAQIEDLDRLCWIVGTPDNSLGVLVRDCRNTDVGAYYLETARGSVVRRPATSHQARRRWLRHINDRKALPGSLLDVQVVLVSFVLEKHFAACGILQRQMCDHLCRNLGR